MDPKTKAPAVLPLEQVGPKGWVRMILCLEMQEDYDIDRISSILHAAWASFKQRTPMVGVEAVPDVTPGKPAGMVKLQAYSDGEIVDFVVKDHRGDTELPSFAQLKTENFPIAPMDDEKLCLRGLGGEWPKPGIDRIATHMMQANLVKGGLLLNHLWFHAFADATTARKLMELFAEDLRRAQGVPIEQPAEMPMSDRIKLERSTGERVCTNFAEEHPEFTHLPFTPDSMPEGLTGPDHHGHIFRFTPEAIRELKRVCTRDNVCLAEHLKSAEQLPSFVSTNDVLTAFLWRCIQRAEHPDHSAIAADKRSLIQVAIDSRRRAHVPIHPQTIGNMVGFAATSLPTQQIFSSKEASFADLAFLIREAVSKYGKSYYDEVANYVENMDDVNRLAGTTFLDMPGANMLVSNWHEFDFYSIEWGPTFGGRTKALRFPASGICAGFQVILPSPPDAPEGTYDVLVNLSDRAWPRLLADETWSRVAMNPTTTEYK